MRRTLIVALREFRQRVTSRAFLMSAIGTPLILLVIALFAGGFSLGSNDTPDERSQDEGHDSVIGYVDQADLIESVPDSLPPDTFQAYADIASAEAALSEDKIAACYLVPPNYRETGQVQRISSRLPTAPPDTDLFNRLLLSNLLPQAEQIELLRAPLGPSGPTYVSLERESGLEKEDGGNALLPFAITLAVTIPLYSGASYLFQSLTQEKSNRVIEILLASLRPRQLLTGKLIGLAALTLVQYAIWIAIALLPLSLTGQGIAQVLSGVDLTGGEVLLVVLYALGGFSLYAALMAGIGALSPDMDSSRTWLFMISLPMMIPFYLWQPIVSAPEGSLAIALSLFPPSAPVAMLMRMITTAVPAWQFCVGLALLLLTVIGTIRLMARLFRAQTLLSGESLSAKRFWAALTQG